MSRILWRSETLQSTEACELSEIPGGIRLSGLFLAPVDGRPVHIVYQVDADDRWRTRSVQVTLSADGASRTLTLGADGEGNWEVDGMPQPSLEGALDVDLNWSPSTNTLPIRRLGLDGPRRAGTTGEGERSAEVAAAFVRYPDLAVLPLRQVYERLEGGRWRYRAGDFEAELLTDADGLVLEYEGQWSAIGHSEPDRLRR